MGIDELPETPKEQQIMKGSLADAITKIISPDAGQAAAITEEDKRLIAEYQKEISSLPPEAMLLAFKNVISKQGSCGFASGGTKDYLVNTDTGNRYRVTVRTYWTQGINSGQYDNVYISEAGGKQLLGCTDSGAIPVAYYNRQVVGEVRI
jgi:hypothetical protein